MHKIESEYLKCDASGCDHVENVDCISQNLVGKACPKCGANLLTQDDYDHYVQLRGLLSLLKTRAPEKVDGQQVNLSVNVHNGQFKIKGEAV